MSNNNDKNQQSVVASVTEKLKATDRHLLQLKEILSKMDDIDRLNCARNGVARTVGEDTIVGGYKRSSVEKLIVELEKQRDNIMSDLIKLEKTPKQKPLTYAEQREKTVQEIAAAKQSPIDNLSKNDTALILEGLYNGVARDMENLKKEIMREMRYSYQQDLAIHDDMTDLISGVTTTTVSKVEECLSKVKEFDVEKLKSDMQKMQEENLLALANLVSQKVLEAQKPIDYDLIINGVVTNLGEVQRKVDYDVLADKVAEKLADKKPEAIPAKLIDDGAINSKLNEIQATVNQVFNVKEMPEMVALDEKIFKYIDESDIDLIPELLIDSTNIRKKAHRYFMGGNVMRGEAILYNLSTRLKRVNVCSSKGIAVIISAMEQNDIALKVNVQGMTKLKKTCFDYEKSPLLCDDEIINNVMRVKSEIFNDSSLAEFDKLTFRELASATQDINTLEDMDEDKANEINELRKELMSFNLAYLFDLEAPSEVESTATNIDVNSVVAEILKAVKTEQVNANVAENKNSEEIEAKPLIVNNIGLTKTNVKPNTKKQKILRPSVTAKDGKADRVAQPLKTRRNSIDLSDDNPESLSNTLVGKLAKTIASQIKNK